MPTYARRQIDCSDRRVCGCLDSPSLHGVREGTFPRFLATMKRSDSGPPISPHFVAFAWRYHPCVLFAPSDPTQGRGLRGVGIPVPEPDMSGEEGEKDRHCNISSALCTTLAISHNPLLLKCF